MTKVTVLEVQRVISEEDRQRIMKDAAEALAGGDWTPKFKMNKYTTKLLSYNPRYHMSIPIYEFWDKILEWEGHTFELLYPLSRGTEYTARYREITDEKE